MAGRFHLPDGLLARWPAGQLCRLSGLGVLERAALRRLHDLAAQRPPPRGGPLRRLPQAAAAPQGLLPVVLEPGEGRGHRGEGRR
ncbi:hypothetical protein FRAHR75_1710004 [Frankia sp. Hr75.2]|nr:hypothetical protein FRAHR75_1710004 [Frankia sp. Hr75.2]